MPADENRVVKVKKKSDSSSNLGAALDNSKQVPKKSKGRPKTGKRSSFDHKQTTVYLTKETLAEVKIKLVKESTSDMSDVVESLLKRWISGDIDF